MNLPGSHSDGLSLDAEVLFCTIQSLVVAIAQLLRAVKDVDQFERVDESRLQRTGALVVARVKKSFEQMIQVDSIGIRIRTRTKHAQDNKRNDRKDKLQMHLGLIASFDLNREPFKVASA